MRRRRARRSLDGRPDRLYAAKRRDSMEAVSEAKALSLRPDPAGRSCLQRSNCHADRDRRVPNASRIELPVAGCHATDGDREAHAVSCSNRPIAECYAGHQLRPDRAWPHRGPHEYRSKSGRHGCGDTGCRVHRFRLPRIRIRARGSPVHGDRRLRRSGQLRQRGGGQDRQVRQGDRRRSALRLRQEWPRRGRQRLRCGGHAGGGRAPQRRDDAVHDPLRRLRLRGGRHARLERLRGSDEQGRPSEHGRHGQSGFRDVRKPCLRLQRRGGTGRAP